MGLTLPPLNNIKGWQRVGTSNVIPLTGFSKKKNKQIIYSKACWSKLFLDYSLSRLASTRTAPGTGVSDTRMR
jgi:hypothetical protein